MLLPILLLLLFIHTVSELYSFIKGLELVLTETMSILLYVIDKNTNRKRSWLHFYNVLNHSCTCRLIKHSTKYNYFVTVPMNNSEVSVFYLSIYSHNVSFGPYIPQQKSL